MLSNAIVHAIQRGDYFRRPALRVAGRGDFKEWVHFCCMTEELEILVNFSIVHSAGRETARLLCAVRTDHWEGDVDSFAADEVSVEAGGMDIALGASSARFDGQRYHVAGALRRRPVAFELALEPLALPCLTHNIGLGQGARLHWFSVPALRTQGWVKVDGHLHTLRDAFGYHDRNWGDFSWGRRTSWFWGYGHGACDSGTYTLTFDRLTDRGRTCDAMRALLLWRDGRQYRVFNGAELSMVQHGQFRPRSRFQLPRSAGLLRPEQTLDVPEELQVDARSGADWARLRFRPRDLCQILVPNDDDLDFTVISEATGELRAEGCVRGVPFAFTTATVFEFLHG